MKDLNTFEFCFSFCDLKEFFKSNDFNLKVFFNLQTCSYDDLLENKNKFLSAEEIKIFNNMKFKKKKKSYLLGRYSAKIAITKYFKSNSYKAFTILNSVVGNPFLKNYDINLSISHNKNVGCSLVSSPFLPIVVDIESNSDLKNTDFSAFNKNEYKKFCKFDFTKDEIDRILWCAKECLGKFLKTGFSIPFELLKVENIEKNNYCVTVFFKNFVKCKSYVFLLNDYTIGIGCPFDVELDDKRGVFKSLSFLDV